MNLKFTKMHGIGNDFVVLDAINQFINLNETQIRFLADRHFGIGCDQILLIEHTHIAGVDFRYRIFNADGGEVEQCGNGARCFARYVFEKKLTDKSQIRVETHSGIIVLHIGDNGEVTVNMGAPELKPAKIPIAIDRQSLHYQITVGKEFVDFGAVSMGNPHVVLKVDDLDKAPVTLLGAKLESHSCFPQRANIGFMQIISRSQIKLRVYERGAAETLACGTGACAAVVIGQLWGLLDTQVMVGLPGGNLRIQWQGEGESVFLTGPTSFVFEGEVRIPA